MQEALDHTPLRASVLDAAYEWFHRLVAAFSLLFGVLYWVRIIGLYQGTEWRFDLMPVHWQVAAVVLAVLFPFAASGLWMLASWGVVIWAVCALIEVTMYAGFPDLFGSHLLLLLAHLIAASIYCAFRIAFFVRARRIDD